MTTRRMLGDAPIAELPEPDPRVVVEVHLQVNGEAHAARVSARTTLSGLAAGDGRPYRHKEGLQRRGVRGLHRTCRRAANEQLPDPARQCDGCRSDDSGRPCRAGRRAPPGTAGFHRPRRLSVRLLHAGTSPVRGSLYRRGPYASRLEEVREWMSGNICRCAAYPQITAAVMAVAEAGMMREFTYTRPDVEREPRLLGRATVHRCDRRRDGIAQLDAPWHRCA